MKPKLNANKKHRLSKSKIILGQQCEKALYLSVHQPDLVEEISGSQQMVFDQGQEIGSYAQTLFPDGTIINAPHNDSLLALEQTQAALKANALNIYEATFEFDGVLVKVDILTRSKKQGSWKIVEVKSSTQAKEVHIQDAAIQLWVLRNAGLRVMAVSILYINNQCVFPDLSDLLIEEDVTEAAEALQVSTPKSIATLQKMLKDKSEPKRDIGPHCDDPYECGFKKHCWSKKKIPAISTFNIPRLSSKRKWEFYSEGTVALDSIDPIDFNDIQRRMIKVTLSKRRFVDRAAIKREISKWTYPFSFLDFETIAFAIPRYEGLKPYQQLPFQFSCHIQENDKRKLDHCEYLHQENSDPREAIAFALVEMLPTEGSVVAYNMGFEKQVILALAERFPRMKKKLISFAERLVDPLTIFRSHVYDPEFKGSFSIKEVAPAILGKNASYEGMAVSDGSESQAAFLRLISTETTSKTKENLTKELQAYCQKDTLGMAELVWWLQESGKGGRTNAD